MRFTGLFCAVSLAATLAATPLLAQTTKSSDPGNTTEPTGKQMTNGGKGSGTGTAGGETGQNADQMGVNKGRGSGTGTMQPKGTNGEADTPAK